jgi:hypothetical protein
MRDMIYYGRRGMDVLCKQFRPLPTGYRQLGMRGLGYSRIPTCLARRLSNIISMFESVLVLNNGEAMKGIAELDSKKKTMTQTSFKHRSYSGDFAPVAPRFHPRRDKLHIAFAKTVRIQQRTLFHISDKVTSRMLPDLTLASAQMYTRARSAQTAESVHSTCFRVARGVDQHGSHSPLLHRSTRHPLSITTFFHPS